MTQSSQKIIKSPLQFTLKQSGAHLLKWIKQHYPFGLAGLALLSGIVTYAILSGTVPIEPTRQTFYILTFFNSALFILLGGVIGRQVLRVWRQRRRGYAGANLNARLVKMFSFVALAPVVIVAVFSAVFFHFVLNHWFSSRVQTALNESTHVAQSYLAEHKKNIEADIQAMAHEISVHVKDPAGSKFELKTLLNQQMLWRSLSEAILLDSRGRVYESARQPWADQKVPLPDWALREAIKGKVITIKSEGDDRVRSLLKLDGFSDLYLYVGREVDPAVIEHIEHTRAAVQDYFDLEGQRPQFQLMFALIFIVVALTLLLAAVWFGLNISSQLVRPIGQLIRASERVRAGDLDVRVQTDPIDGEIHVLGESFNKMVGQISEQHDMLIEANRLINNRSRFTEAVLSKVSAGVIGLDAHGRVHLYNKRASELLGHDLSKRIGMRLIEITPEMKGILSNCLSKEAVDHEPSGRHITVESKGRSRTLVVDIAHHVTDEGGYVLTLDDITELQAAQRQAAWSGVARRVAHEIKNPLTPIQLSAERLKKKYLDKIDGDTSSFIECTDTIIRKVEDMYRIVEEFSSFARMPSPVFKHQDLVSICKEAVSLQKNARQDIRFDIFIPSNPMPFTCDRGQLNQALTNLLKNSIEALDERGDKSKEKIISLTLKRNENVKISIEDNGPGFPEEFREQLKEPYVTTKAKGSGLGLAIVTKIIEDHGGTLELLNGKEGAKVVVTFFDREV